MPKLPRATWLLPALLALTGCARTVVLDPSGDVARQQGDLILVATALMLIVIVPVIALTLVFAWRYRASNRAAKYTPEGGEILVAAISDNIKEINMAERRMVVHLPEWEEVK